MLLRTIRSRLLGLVLATVVPLVIVIGGGLWSQLRHDQTEAMEDALDEARLLAAQVDDHIGNLENLLLGVSQAVSPRLADANANDALLRQIKKDLPDYIANILLLRTAAILEARLMPMSGASMPATGLIFSR